MGVVSRAAMIMKVWLTHVQPKGGTMVDIKEGINIGQSRCLGVAPGRTESEIICSFCNGLIAIYSVSTNLYYFLCNNNNSYFS